MGEKGPNNFTANAVAAFAGFCAAVLLCVSACGCGYTFANTPLTEQYRTIAVPAFKNQTFEPDLQIEFNNILVRELLNDGRLRVVDDPAVADLVLTGALTEYEPYAVSFVEDDEIGQFRIVIMANAALQETRTGETLWQGSDLRGTDFYQTVAGRSREEAISSALEELAELIIFESIDNYW